jgi:hypothetical protein
MKQRIGFMMTLIATAVPALADVGSTGRVTLASGPHAGKFQYSVDDACVIAALPGKPVGFSIFMLGEKSSLTIDIPNADAAHVSQAQIELVVADVKPGQSRKDTSSATYTIDTRPDAALENYQRAERKGMAGKASVALTQDAKSARLTFSGSTAAGVKLEGSVDCHKVDREYGR